MYWRTDASARGNLCDICSCSDRPDGVWLLPDDGAVADCRGADLATVPAAAPGNQGLRSLADNEQVLLEALDVMDGDLTCCRLGLALCRNHGRREMTLRRIIVHPTHCLISTQATRAASLAIAKS